MGVGTFVIEEHEVLSDSISDLFETPKIEKAILQGKTLTFYPDSAIDDTGPYEIKIPAADNSLYDLNKTKLNLVLEVTKTDGTQLGDNDAISVVNLFGHSIIKQIEVYANDTQINDLSTPTYPYKVAIEKTLSQNALMKATQLPGCEFWQKETIGFEENFILDKPASGTGQSAIAAVKSDSLAFKAKHAKIKGKKIYLTLNLHLDVLHSVKYLIPGVRLRFKFIRNDDSFSLLGDTKIAKISVKKMSMDMHNVIVDGDVIGGILDTLNNNKAIYPICQSKIKTFLLNSGTQSTVISQVFSGKLPRQFIACMVDAKGYDGQVNRNPFHFQNFGLKSFSPKINGIGIPLQPLEFDWSSGDYVRGYDWFLENIGCGTIRSVNVTIDDWKTNTFMLPFDLSGDRDNGYHYRNPANGSIDFHINFDSPLTQNVILIVYASFNQILQIDKFKSVSWLEKEN